MNAPQQMPNTGDNPVIPFAPRPDAYIRLRTGLPGASIRVSEQDRPAFAALRDSLLGSVGPKTGLEVEVFGHLLNAAWQLRRLSQWEEDLLGQPVNPFLDSDCEARLRRFQNYKAAKECSFQTALAELGKLQTERVAVLQTGEFEEAQVPVKSRGAAVICIAKAACGPLRLCVLQSRRLAGSARGFLGLPSNLRQMPSPTLATAA